MKKIYKVIVSAVIALSILFITIVPASAFSPLDIFDTLSELFGITESVNEICDADYLANFEQEYDDETGNCIITHISTGTKFLIDEQCKVYNITGEAVKTITEDEKTRFYLNSTALCTIISDLNKCLKDQTEITAENTTMDFIEHNLTENIIIDEAFLGLYLDKYITPIIIKDDVIYFSSLNMKMAIVSTAEINESFFTGTMMQVWINIRSTFKGEYCDSISEPDLYDGVIKKYYKNQLHKCYYQLYCDMENKDIKRLCVYYDNALTNSAINIIDDSTTEFYFADVNGVQIAYDSAYQQGYIITDVDIHSILQDIILSQNATKKNEYIEFWQKINDLPEGSWVEVTPEDDKDIILPDDDDFFGNIFSSITDAITSAFSNLFLPSDTYFSDMTTRFNDGITNKLPFVNDLGELINSLFVDIQNDNLVYESDVDEIIYPKWECTFEFFGSEYTIVFLDFSQFASALQPVRLIIMVFVYIAYFMNMTRYLPTLIGNVGDMLNTVQTNDFLNKKGDD